MLNMVDFCFLGKSFALQSTICRNQDSFLIMRTCLRRLVVSSVRDQWNCPSESQATAFCAQNWHVAGLKYFSAAQAEVPPQGELTCCCIMFANLCACCGGLL